MKKTLTLSTLAILAISFVFSGISFAGDAEIIERLRNLSENQKAFFAVLDNQLAAEFYLVPIKSSEKIITLADSDDMPAHLLQWIPFLDEGKHEMHVIWIEQVNVEKELWTAKGFAYLDNTFQVSFNSDSITIDGLVGYIVIATRSEDVYSDEDELFYNLQLRGSISRPEAEILVKAINNYKQVE